MKAFVHYPLLIYANVTPQDKRWEWPRPERRVLLKEGTPEEGPHSAVYLLNAIAFLEGPSPTALLSHQNISHCFVLTQKVVIIYTTCNTIIVVCFFCLLLLFSEPLNHWKH